MRQVINKSLKIKLFAVACGASLAALMAAPKVDALKRKADNSGQRVVVGTCIDNCNEFCATDIYGKKHLGVFVEIDTPIIIIEEPEEEPEDLPTE